MKLCPATESANSNGHAASSSILQHDRRIGFLAVFCGGVGRDAGRIVCDRHAADGRPFPLTTLHVDTEPVTDVCFDRTVDMPMTPDLIDAVRSDPSKFGPAVELICELYPQYLNPEASQNGSRTIPLLTQLAFQVYRPEMVRALRESLHSLLDNHNVSRVIPMFVCSSGGGTGGPTTLLLIDALQQQDFHHAISQALPPGTLERPVTVVSDPWALAQTQTDLRSKKILANAFAFRSQSELLERRGATQYIVHIGLANRNGVVLKDKHDIDRVLGTAVYELQHCWQYIKARNADGVDTEALGKGYVGDDLVESRWRRNGHPRADDNFVLPTHDGLRNATHDNAAHEDDAPPNADYYPLQESDE